MPLTYEMGFKHPKFTLFFFGFFMGGLTYFWARWIFNLDEITAIFLAILFLVFYQYLFYKLVYLKEKNKPKPDKKYIICKHCGSKFDASESLICPACSMTNAY